MPLTPCHAAAAWPLARLAPQLPLAALVVGCLAPDFEYLLLLEPRGRTWHTPLGLATLAIPVGVLVWTGWRAVVRPAVRRMLPPRLQSALAPSPWTATSLAAGVAAVALGAGSHVVWDAFTHGGDWAVARWGVLQTPVGAGPVTVPLYKVLQHGSTLGGALALVVWGLRWWRRQPHATRAFAPGQTREIAVVIGGLLTAAALGAGLNTFRAPPGLAARLGYAAVGGMLALGVAVFAWGALRASPRSTARDPAS